MSLLDKIKSKVAEKPLPPPKLVLSERETSLLDDLSRRAAQKKRPNTLSDIDRICALPIIFPLTDEEVVAVNEMHCKVDAPDGFKLERVQAEALYSWSSLRRVLGPIEVGGGKTLIALRILAMALETGEHRKACLVVPPQVLTQLIESDIPWARRRVPLGCQFHVLGKKSRAERMMIAQGTPRGVFILPYSVLSTEDGSELLRVIKPSLIVFDEAHNLKNKNSTRTRRVAKYIKDFKPKVVILSGTITNKSVKDLAHLSEWALGDTSPLPLDTDAVYEWAAVVDSDGNNWDPVREQRVGTGPLRPLITWSNQHFKHEQLDANVEGFRRAIQNRFLTAPGVVASPADSLGASLLMNNEPAKVAEDYPGWAELKKFDRDIDILWQSPSGDELEWAMHKFRYRYEVSAGFYHRLDWPDEAQWAEKHGIQYDEACAIVEAAKLHHAKLQEYHKELRDWLKYHNIEGLDSPMLVGRNMHEHGEQFVGRRLYTAWKAAKDLAFDGMPQRISRPVRVCDYKVQAAVQWAKGQDRGGIIWYVNQGLGVWLQECLTAAGIDAVHCPAGNQFNDILTNAAAPDRFRKAFAVCSIMAHGTGKNLQYFDRQFFVQFPRPEETAQQVLGRIHRKGQTADEVVTATCITTDIDEISLAATLNDSVYVFETMGSRRKVLFATWEPMPSIYGRALLDRAGADAKQLNIRQRAILEERFGRSKG